jgi:hypothetical protein
MSSSSPAEDGVQVDEVKTVVRRERELLPSFVRGLVVHPHATTADIIAYFQRVSIDLFTVFYLAAAYLRDHPSLPNDHRCFYIQVAEEIKRQKMRPTLLADCGFDPKVRTSYQLRVFPDSSLITAYDVYNPALPKEEKRKGKRKKREEDEEEYRPGKAERKWTEKEMQRRRWEEEEREGKEEVLCQSCSREKMVKGYFCIKCWQDVQ